MSPSYTDIYACIYISVCKELNWLWFWALEVMVGVNVQQVFENSNIGEIVFCSIS